MKIGKRTKRYVSFESLWSKYFENELNLKGLNFSNNTDKIGIVWKRLSFEKRSFTVFKKIVWQMFRNEKKKLIFQISPSKEKKGGAASNQCLKFQRIIRIMSFSCYCHAFTMESCIAIGRSFHCFLNLYCDILFMGFFSSFLFRSRLEPKI